MKNSWNEVSLDSITELINRGVSPKYVESDGYPIINQKCIRDGFVSLQHARMTSKVKKITSEKFVRSGDVLINSTGTGTLGRTAIVKNINQDTTVDTHVTIVRANKLVDKYFLGYLIRYHEPVITLLGKGATNQIELSRKDLEVTKVKIPTSKIIQQKIGEILSAYDDLIENNIKRIEILEEQAQLIYEEWFVRMRFPDYENTLIDEEIGLPEGWTYTNLVQIAEINAESISSSFDGNIKYIDISSVSTKSIDHTTKYPIKEAPGRAKRIITHGDIIWSCVRPNRKSYAVIWNPEENTIASTGFTVITPTEVPTSFLYQVLGTEQFVGYLTNRATGAAYPAVKSIDFKEYVISLPPKSLIHKFDEHAKNYIDVIGNLKQQNERLKEARDILLPRLMMGIIEV